MALGQRILQVAISSPGGQTVTLDDSLDIHVKIHKDALAIQNTCDITIVNLTRSLREQLLSSFTAWNKRQVETGGSQPSYCDVEVVAGYKSGQQSNTKVVFAGQIVEVIPGDAPPNLSVTISCYAQQASKLNWIVGNVPDRMAFKEYVQWAGQQLGVSQVICDTSYDDVVITNPVGSTEVVGHLLIDIQNMYRPNVAAFIDNNVLNVVDTSAVVAVRGSVTVDEFIGTPMWTEWGVQFTTLFNPQLILAGAATLNSKMNPSLNKSYIISTLDYDLASRDTPFYVKATGHLPA